MRTWRVTGISGPLLLAGPTVLAFFTGGYFATARAWAGVLAAGLAALLLALGAIGRRRGPIGRPLLPTARAGRVALIALLALGAWTAASIGWAPIAGRAYAATQIAVLYAVALLAAVIALRQSPALARWLEPGLAGGVLVVCGYALAGRMLPGVIAMVHSPSANGRLEQPLTYWNAMGELAAVGFVLSARLAGDLRRPAWLRTAAAGAGAPLGLALYLSFSRGALYACVAGLAALIVAAPTRAQLRGLLVCAGAGVLATAACSSLAGVTGLHGSLSLRETEGLEALGATLVAILAAVAIMVWLDRPDGPRPLGLPRHSGRIAAVLVCAGLAVAIGFGAHERTGVALSGSASRLTTLQSNRYDYWHVAFEAFAHAPLVGVGAGGWSVWWLQRRPYADGATDTHSLELQTLAELGVVGLALLAVFLVAIGFAGRTALRTDPARAAGPLAALVVWLVHSPLDWDWQMPALTLVAVVLAGGLIAAGEREPDALAGADAPGSNVDGVADVPAPAPAGRRLAATGAGELVLAGVAALVCAWFVIGVRQADSQSAAEAAILQNSHPVTAAAAVGLRAQLDRAGTLNPDRQIDLDRAALLLDVRERSAAGERRRELEAQAIIRGVIAAEPENLQAWVLLAHASANDPALFRYALVRARKLEPLIP